MTHIPTGIVVSMQNEKSQIQNRAAALRVLQSRLLLVRKAEEDAKKKALAGDVKASWGDQMRSYVLQPYQMVKDLRTEHEVGNPAAVFDGDIDDFIEAGIRWRRSAEKSRRPDRRSRFARPDLLPAIDTFVDQARALSCGARTRSGWLHGTCARWASTPEP